MQEKYNKVYGEVDGYVVTFPEIDKLADEQAHVFWPHSEIAVENDAQDLKFNMTEGELHGMIETLRLFTQYEISVGQDYWVGRVSKKFKLPEIQRMATMFAAVEFNSHMPFYSKVNELLNLNTKEFFGEWRGIEDLRKRMEFISEAVKSEDDALSIAAFSMIEGSVLYSNFAFIKHFQAPLYSKDLMKNTCRGVDMSVGDEHLHSLGGAMLFNLVCEDKEKYKEAVYRMAKEILAHEEAIVERIFSKGIPKLNKEDILSFVKQRIDLCLENLGYEPLFNDTNTTVADWFYQNTTSIKLHDFFSGGTGSEYSINWNPEKFKEVW